jgi:hypothetical protein
VEGNSQSPPIAGEQINSYFRISRVEKMVEMALAAKAEGEPRPGPEGICASLDRFGPFQSDKPGFAVAWAMVNFNDKLTNVNPMRREVENVRPQFQNI